MKDIQLMPIDRLQRHRPCDNIQATAPSWRPVPDWKAPTKVVFPSPSVASSSVVTPAYAGSQQHGASRRRKRMEMQSSSGKRSRQDPPSQSSVRIGAINGKGQGLFALKPFQAGTTIFRERPFVTFRDPLTSLEAYTALAALSPADRDAFWSFSGRGAHTPMDVDIAETNLIPLEGEESCGMFMTICKINHCCSPNARWIWSSSESKMAVRALCEIAIDEEITVSYLDPGLLIAPERKDWIKSHYHFDCICKTCTSPTSAESDANRARIKTAFERWESQPIDEWFSPDQDLITNKLQTLNEIDRVEQIIKEECLTVFLPQLLEYKFQLHAAWGEYGEAHSVGHQWEIEEKMIGERKGEGLEVVSRIRRNPRKWSQWGQLKKLYGLVGRARPPRQELQYGRKTSGLKRY